MGNTLTNLIPDAYVALDVVSRELVGLIPSVTRDPSADQVAVGQTLRIPQAPANAAGGDFVPSMTFPAAANQTIGNKSLTITKQRFWPFSWSGEEQYALNEQDFDGAAGSGYLSIQQDQIAQAFRTAINEMEADISLAAYLAASRAWGTAGTTPFASNLTDPAQVKKILDDNGAPPTDRSMVINTTAGAALRTLTQLTKANEANDDSLLRQGTLLDLHGFRIRESAQVKAVVKGTGAGYLTNGALAIGATTIPANTGAGTILAGDVVTFAGDTNKYVVAAALAAGSFTINAPGLINAVLSGVAITVGNSYSANLAFSRNAILLATRLPIVPVNGDLATDRQTITDPRTGISFELSYYPGLGMGVYMLRCNWGVTVIKPEHVAILLG